MSVPARRSHRVVKVLGQHLDQHIERVRVPDTRFTLAEQSGAIRWVPQISITSRDEVVFVDSSQVDGKFSFLYNTGWLYVGSPLRVGGSFTASGNGPYANPAVANMKELTLFIERFLQPLLARH